MDYRLIFTAFALTTMLVSGCADFDRALGVQRNTYQQPRPTNQSAMRRARDLCTNFGYRPGTTVFARCMEKRYGAALKQAECQLTHADIFSAYLDSNAGRGPMMGETLNKLKAQRGCPP